MKKKLNDKQKLVAYVLNKDPDMGYSMSKIGSLMNVSQSTISNTIKDVSYAKKIHDLESELTEAKKLATEFEEEHKLQEKFYINVDVEDDIDIEDSRLKCSLIKHK